VGSKLLSRTEQAVTGCFVAGTPVLLADGTTKAIEEVEPGDEVTAYNPETGETELRTVVDAFVHHDMPTYDVVIDDGQRVTTTSEHPFMVVGQGWTPVRELRKGDLLVRPDGTTVAIHSVDATGETATVHNFEVDGLHNYYVQAGDEWLLVHNADCGNTLYHYTDEAGRDAIVKSGQLNPSLKAVNPNDARYGDGQYLSDIVPGTKSSPQLSRAFVGSPFQGQRFTHFVEVNVDGLPITQGRPNVFVHNSQEPLDISQRIVSSGPN
jgi:hypothetical protein